MFWLELWAQFQVIGIVCGVSIVVILLFTLFAYPYIWDFRNHLIDWLYDWAYVHDAPREILNRIKPNINE